MPSSQMDSNSWKLNQYLECNAQSYAITLAMLAVCKVVLPGPAAAARAAAAASNKQRAAAESAIAAAVSDVLHLLAALKTAAPLMAGTSLPQLVDALMKLYGLHQPLLSRHTSEVLAEVSASRNSHVTPAQLSQLLTMIVDKEAATLMSGKTGGRLVQCLEASTCAPLATILQIYMGKAAAF